MVYIPNVRVEEQEHVMYLIIATGCELYTLSIITGLRNN